MGKLQSAGDAFPSAYGPGGFSSIKIPQRALMYVDGEVRSFRQLAPDEVVALAHAQAERGEPCSHGFLPGSVRARVWEQSYAERQEDLAAQAVD
jgi:hypothetical protein